MSGVKKVAVVGRGATLWLAALALRRAFARVGIAIVAVELPTEAARRDVYATLPDLTRFHRLLGVAERDLLSCADATFTLGQQFVGWSAADATFLHAYGETGEALHGLPFVQYWTKARANGLAVGFDDFSLNSAAARNNRIGIPGSPRATAYGYHLDALGYETLLRGHAVAHGVTIITATAVSVAIEDGAIAAVRTADQEIQADLFVDATGRERRLIGALPGSGDPCPRASPCDRLLTASAAALSPLPLYSRIAALPVGWLGLFPLASRTAVMMAYSGTLVGDEDAVRMAAAAAGVHGLGDVAIDAIDDHLSARPWSSNCVAIGAAACSGDPIDATDLQRDQIGIANLIALFPLDGEQRVEAGIYNEEVVAQYARMRDFQTAHYALKGRQSEPFWQQARAAPISSELAWKIELFKARGMNAQYNHETFNPDSWQAALVGHGVVPRSYDPQVDAVPDAEVTHHLQQLLSRIREGVGPMISHEAARMRGMQR